MLLVKTASTALSTPLTSGEINGELTSSHLCAALPNPQRHTPTDFSPQLCLSLRCTHFCVAIKVQILRIVHHHLRRHHNFFPHDFWVLFGKNGSSSRPLFCRAADVRTPAFDVAVTCGPTFLTTYQTTGDSAPFKFHGFESRRVYYSVI